MSVQGHDKSPLHCFPSRKENRMCPACLANLTLLVTGLVSTSSIAAGAIKLIRHRKTSAKLLEVQKKKIQAKSGSSQ
jgi:hypothetical protein